VDTYYDSYAFGKLYLSEGREGNQKANNKTSSLTIKTKEWRLFGSA